jgi:hypothetical protein
VLLAATDDALGAEGVRFLLHVPKWPKFRAKYGSHADALLASVRARRNVQVIMDELAPDAYAGLLAEIDVILLPYDPRIFRDAVSALFVSAAAAGTPVITSRDTWMAGELRAGHAAGVLLEPFEPSDYEAGARTLKRAIRSASRQIDVLCFQAEIASRYYRTYWTAEACLRTLAERHGLKLASRTPRQGGPVGLEL